MFALTGWGSDIPMGYLIKDGEVIWSDGDHTANLIGFTEDNKLFLGKMSTQEAVDMLISCLDHH